MTLYEGGVHGRTQTSYMCDVSREDIRFLLARYGL